MTLNTGLIGQPTFGSQNLTAVGPVVSTGSTALASNGNSIISEFQYGSTNDWSQWLADEENLVDAEAAGHKPAPTESVVVQTSTDVPARLEPLAASARADQLALRGREWLVRLVRQGARMAYAGGNRE